MPQKKYRPDGNRDKGEKAGQEPTAVMVTLPVPKGIPLSGTRQTPLEARSNMEIQLFIVRSCSRRYPIKFGYDLRVDRWNSAVMQDQDK